VDKLKRSGLSLWLITIIMGVLTFLPQPAVLAQSGSPVVEVMTASGPLTPAMAEYLSRAIRTAQQENAEALIFQLNTPGGSLDIMNQMVESIRASHVPVVMYVAPRGAMAGSAGTLITLAGHASAMAPETIIGAASPVDQSGQDLSQTEQAKLKNALGATADTLTRRRNPQAVELARQTIESAAAVSAQQALEVGLVDFIANDVNDLLRQLDGFKVETVDGERTLETTNATVQPVDMSFIEQLLSILTNPNVVLVLLNVGVIAILIELSSPGGWVAGAIGVVCLALATYGLGILPVNWFGAVFLILAIVLFILDIKAPTHGALTIAGVLSMIVSGLVLFNSPGVPRFQRVSVPLVVFLSALSGGLFLAVVIYAMRAQKVPISMGPEALIGQIGTASSDLSPRGSVRLKGERWLAELVEGEEPLPQGARVEVVRLVGNRLFVRKERVS
jgi:membrane-bound serine protease (ClpP class)